MWLVVVVCRCAVCVVSSLLFGGCCLFLCFMLLRCVCVLVDVRCVLVVVGCCLLCGDDCCFLMYGV